MERNDMAVKIKPPRIVAALLAVSVILHFLFPLKSLFYIYSPVAGVLVGILGFSIMMWAWFIFKKKETAVCHAQKPSALVIEGPFRFTRNPMYLGMVFILLGIGILMGTIYVFLSAIIFVVAINKIYIPFEEDKMSECFGNDYLKYKKRVRMWL